VAIALESSRGAVINALVQRSWITIYPKSPLGHDSAAGEGLPHATFRLFRHFWLNTLVTMTIDDGTAQSQSIWPLPAFSFRVSWGEQKNIQFQEVSGLDTETQVIEYRHSNSPTHSTIKMPGIKKFGSVTMKKGIFRKDDDFWRWYSAIKMNTNKRVSVVVQLLDERGKVTMTWTLANAWPTKISAPTLKSDGNEVAIQSIEIAHEGITIANG